MTTVPGRDDATLAVAAAAGDRDAFAEIYDRYADHIYDLCTSVLRDRTDAADATQETFLLAGQRLAQLRQPEKLRAWLFAIARHESLRLARSRARVRPAQEVAEMPEPEADVSRPVEQAELRQVVHDAAAGLDTRDRTVLELHLRRGMEGRELAAALGVSENHAGVLMHRVRARFERALGALLVARRGARDCPQLQELLAGWDGRFSPLLRKRVARHVDRCETCAGTRARVASPAALLARVPLVPAPLALREQVLGRLELVGNATPLPRDWRDGFPPPAYPSPRRRWMATAAVAASLLVAAALGWYSVEGYGGGSGGDAAAGATGASAVVETRTPAARPSSGTVAPGWTAPRPRAQPVIPSPTADSSPSPSPLPPVATVGAATADPPQIQQQQSQCQQIPETTSEVSVAVTEHRQVSFVNLHWTVAGEQGVIESLPRAPGDEGVRQAAVGPFEWGTLGPDQTEAAVTLEIEIIGSQGDSVREQLPLSTLALRDCPLE